MTKNSKLVLTALAPLAVLALVCRIWQLVTCIDFETGFFAEDSGFWGLSLYILLGMTAVIVALLCFADKKLGSDAFRKNAPELSSKQTAALGAAFLVWGCAICYDIVNEFSGKIGVSDLVSALMCLTVIAIAFILLSSRTVRPLSGYIMLVPAVGYTVKAAALFISDTVVVRESEKLLALLSYLAAVLFFLSLGRFLSNNETKLSRVKLVFFSSAAFLLNVAGVFSSLSAKLVGPSPINEQIPTPSVSELGTCIVAAAVLICLYARIRKPDTEAEASAEKSL